MNKTMILILCLVIYGCASATTQTQNTKNAVSAQVYQSDYDVIFSKAIDAAGGMGWQITFTDKETGVISAKTAANFLTWGDTISIRISHQEQGVKVDLASGSTGQIVDWGRNKNNILKFYKKLDALVISAE
jgi:hypothetical protein